MIEKYRTLRSTLKNVVSVERLGSMVDMFGEEQENSYDTSELDLAGLVCNNLGDHQCINPKRGVEGGQTWADRAKTIDSLDFKDGTQNG